MTGARRGPDVPLTIHALAAVLARRGGRAYLVGGGVRDHLMGLAVKDWDVEVFGVEGEDLRTELARTGSVNTVGRAFGVYKWTPRGEGRGVGVEIDVSIPRRDSKVGPGHRGIAVTGDPTMSIAEAARRRDLTINAMMWDLVAEELVDPYGGREDLAAGRLRAVDRTTFLEDPLRALRVVQFAARLGFDADPQLVELCREATLAELPPERVQGEWGKLLLKGRHLHLGFDVARRTEVLGRVFPEVAGVDADLALQRLADGPRASFDHEGVQWAVMLGGWLADVPVDAVTATLDRLGLFSFKGYAVRERLLAALAELDAPIDTDAALRRLSTRAELRLLVTVREAVREGAHGGTLDPVRARAEALGVWTGPPAPLLQGRHCKELGMAPGPGMGALLAEVYALQLDGAVATEEDARRVARERLGGA